MTCRIGQVTLLSAPDNKIAKSVAAGGLIGLGFDGCSVDGLGSLQLQLGIRHLAGKRNRIEEASKVGLVLFLQLRGCQT